MKNYNTTVEDCICYSFKHFFFPLSFFIVSIVSSQNTKFTIDNSFPYYVNAQTLGKTPIGGDTIYVNSDRTKPLRFQSIVGNTTNPIVIINKNGQVKIDDPQSWGAIVFENSKYIKISGAGHPNFKYGFLLSANMCGLAFAELSSDCEAEFIKVSHYGFFGIYAKKDYGGNPPNPIPVFNNLIIHDCFIENATEGMYLGETKSPGMEFKHVKVYNNIVKNTGREAIQIANMIEDIQVYNNTLLNSGLDGEIYQTNILQIGDNSEANVYNNILSGAPGHGIINFGKGNCHFYNNYIEATLGIFSDNRLFSVANDSISINNNYFLASQSSEVIKNMNEINYLSVQHNTYNTNIPFYLNQSGNSNNYYVNNNTLTSLPSISFNNPNENDYSLSQSNPTEYLNLGAPGGPEYFNVIPDPIRVSITSDMVIDSVSGGSLQSPALLFDEQNISPVSGLHPTSNSWKPFWNMNKAPYHVIIDLKEERHLAEIYLHDMNDTSNFTVEYGNSSNWNTLFVEPCNSYNTWKKHPIDVTTRYLRFSMYDNVFAAVNEIAIYEYPLVISSSSQIQTTKKVKSSPDKNTFESQNIQFYFNPINKKAMVKFPNTLLGINNIKILDALGNRIYAKKTWIDVNNQTFDISKLNLQLKSGFYIFLTEHESGSIKTIKFFNK